MPDEEDDIALNSYHNNSLDTVQRFIDHNIQWIRNGLYVVCGVGVLIIGKSIYVTQVFNHAGEIPAKFVKTNLRLLGQAKEVTQDGLIKVQHIPPLKMPFRKQSQDGKLLVKLACLDISPEGRLWLGNTVINKTIWFQLLHRTVPIIHCKVIIPRTFRSIQVNEELMKNGLCKVSSIEHLEKEYSEVSARSKTFQKYLDRMIYLESIAFNKQAGLWKINKPLENNWRKKTFKAVKTIASSPFRLVYWIYSRFRKTKEKG